MRWRLTRRLPQSGHVIRYREQFLGSAGSGQDRQAEHGDAPPAGHAAERRWQGCQAQADGRRHHGADANVEAENGRERRGREGLETPTGGQARFACDNGHGDACRSPGLRRGLLWGAGTNHAITPGAFIAFIKAPSASDGIAPEPLIRRYTRRTVPAGESLLPDATVRSPTRSHQTVAYTVVVEV